MTHSPVGADPDSASRRNPLLLLLLSATALVVFALRTIQAFEYNSALNAPLPWFTVVVTQGAYWVAWSIWSIALVPLVGRMVDRRPSLWASVPLFVLLALLPILIVPALSLPVHKLAMPPGQGWPASFHHLQGHNAPTNLLLGATLVAVAWGYLTIRRARQLETMAARLHGQLADAQLDTLRAQLNPHFLFNTLNSIAVLARRGQNESVEKMVTGLAGLLRHSLESSREQLVTLGVELAALRQYLEIEQIRFRERLETSIEVPENLHSRMVPSFLLQPLTENAIRHGFVDAETPLRLSVRAEASSEQLRLTIVDDGAGLGALENSPDGTGLGHTRARLAGLYGGKAELSLTAGPDGRGVTVRVVLPSSTHGAKR